MQDQEETGAGVDGAGRTCFVTGATGFIALNLIDELLRKGWSVHALHRAGSARARMLLDLPHAADSAAASRLTPVEGDLNFSANAFAALVPGNCDVIYHICHVAESATHPARVLSAPGFQPEGAAEHKRLNREAMGNVLHAAKVRGVRRIVYCSSWSAYGRQPDGTDVHERSENLAGENVEAALCGLCGAANPPVPYFECKRDLETQLEDGAAGGGDASCQVEVVIIQPCSVFGRYGDTGWCTIFGKLLDSNGRMPGLPGASSFCDVQDLAGAFVAAAHAGAGAAERYIIGGTNASNLHMQAEMATLVGVPPPARATPAGLLRGLAAWNEALLHVPYLRGLRVKPDTIASPWLIHKITQNQSATSAAASQALGYRPRPLADTLARNHQWLLETGRLPAHNKGKDSRL